MGVPYFAENRETVPLTLAVPESGKLLSFYWKW
jgi:hypothetical protein